MKLDTTGLQSFPSLISHGNSVAGEISAPPSFELPNSNDVSTFLFVQFYDSEGVYVKIQNKIKLGLKHRKKMTRLLRKGLSFKVLSDIFFVFWGFVSSMVSLKKLFRW